MTQSVVARVHCPYPRQVHPAVEDLLEQTCSWAKQMGLVRDEQKLRLAGYPRLAAYLHPAARFDALALVARFLVCAFAVDDTFDDLVAQPTLRETFVRECLSIIEVERVGDLSEAHSINPPLMRALHDFWRQAFPNSSYEWRLRFLDNMREYLLSNVWEGSNRIAHTVPDMATYLLKRKVTGCLIPITDLFDIAEETPLPTALWKRQEVQGLLLATALHTSLVNDFVSFTREVRMGDVHNALIILLHHEQLGLQEAVDRVSEMIFQQVVAFEATAARLGDLFAEHADSLARFVAYLRRWMRGNLDWETESYRFKAAPGERALLNPIHVVVDEQ